MLKVVFHVRVIDHRRYEAVAADLNLSVVASSWAELRVAVRAALLRRFGEVRAVSLLAG